SVQAITYCPPISAMSTSIWAVGSTLMATGAAAFPFASISRSETVPSLGAPPTPSLGAAFDGDPAGAPPFPAAAGGAPPLPSAALGGAEGLGAAGALAAAGFDPAVTEANAAPRSVATTSQPSTPLRAVTGAPAAFPPAMGTTAMSARSP